MLTQFQNTMKSDRAKKWPMAALEALLLAVSAWRTWDFVSQVMSDLPGVAIYALLSVLISEGAYLAWAKVAFPQADQGKQESVSILLIALNTVGLLLLSFGENITRAVTGFSWAATAGGILAFTPWALLAVNLTGALLYALLDDDHIDAKTIKAQNRLDRNAERDLKHAERYAHISAKLAAIDQLQAESEGLARELSPYYLKDITDRVRGQTMTALKRRVSNIEKQEAQAVVTADDRLPAGVVSGNGTHPKN